MLAKGYKKSLCPYCQTLKSHCIIGKSGFKKEGFSIEVAWCYEKDERKSNLCDSCEYYSEEKVFPKNNKKGDENYE